MTEQDNTHFDEQMRRAVEIVRGWPLWKQSMLENSGKPQWDVARPIVVLDEKKTTYGSRDYLR